MPAGPVDRQATAEKWSFAVHCAFFKLSPLLSNKPRVDLLRPHFPLSSVSGTDSDGFALSFPLPLSLPLSFFWSLSPHPSSGHLVYPRHASSVSFNKLVDWNICWLWLWIRAVLLPWPLSRQRGSLILSGENPISCSE